MTMLFLKDEIAHSSPYKWKVEFIKNLLAPLIIFLVHSGFFFVTASLGLV